MSRYRPDRRQKAAGFPVAAACQATEVSASAFSAWTAKRVPGQPAAEQAKAELLAEIHAIFAWIAWYNHFRLHSTNDHLPPTEWEQQHTTTSPLPSTTAA